MTESVKAASLGGSIEFLGKGVVIKTKGGTTTVPLDRIQGVEFKKAGLTAGHLRVNVAGSEAPTAGAFGKVRNKSQQVQLDPHAVQFSKASRNAEFEAVADAINRALLGG